MIGETIGENDWRKRLEETIGEMIGETIVEMIGGNDWRKRLEEMIGGNDWRK